MHSLIRNHNTEREIRAWLDANGYYGNSARFTKVELFAIERPGWKQVFEFAAEVKERESDQWLNYWGAVYNDERLPAESRTHIELFSEESQRAKRLEDLAEGLLTIGAARSQRMDARVILALFPLLVLVILVAALIRWLLG